MFFKLIIIATVISCSFAPRPIILNKALGEKCHLDSNENGNCTMLNACPSIRNIMKQRKSINAYCGFVDRKPIVCCPIADEDDGSLWQIYMNTMLNTNRTCTAKCIEYKEAVYDKKLIYVPTADENVMTISSNCAFTAKPLIVGGSNATLAEFPHMAIIGYENDQSGIKWFCGGSLISDEYVLTAGHCIQTDHGPAKYVRLGVHRISDFANEHTVQLRISEFIEHPNYMSPSKYNDIALLRLERKIGYNQFIRPACLPPADIDDYILRKVIATGWGQTKTGSVTSDILQKVVLEHIPADICSETFKDLRSIRSRGIDNRTQICAGTKNDTDRDTCQGDSGGPLQIYHPHHCMYTIVGVTSFGAKDCGKIGVYTRVVPFVDWIESVVWPKN